MKFTARWGEYLKARIYDADAPMPPVSPARSRQSSLGDGPVAVLHTPYDLIAGNGERYLLTAADALRQSHRVYVATDAPYSDYRLDFLARELSLDLDGVSLITSQICASLASSTCSLILETTCSRPCRRRHAATFMCAGSRFPDRCEHFGVSILEAMAHGCVPFVVANGGPIEFVRENDTGFQYDTLDELVAKTRRLTVDQSAVARMSARAQAEARRFSQSVFMQRLHNVLTA